ncbi:MAG: carboxypeptidase regulatory-like domain-containing protein [Planctomycetes bacterium]|nr:carboxypeptidase regulatory-like domain-containing protein [Planctomycetota bacterium]
MTNVRGEFVFDSLPADRAITLFVQRAGRTANPEEGPQHETSPLRLLPGERREGYLVTLPEDDGVVAGTIFFEGTSDPWMGCHVSLEGSSSSRFALIDDRGRFAFPHVPSGPYVLRAGIEGRTTTVDERFELAPGGVRRNLYFEVNVLSGVPVRPLMRSR